MDHFLTHNVYKSVILKVIMESRLQNIERPLDFLSFLKGKDVIVRIKNQDKVIRGVLIAFDIHLNIVLEKVPNEFIRGDAIISVAAL